LHFHSAGFKKSSATWVGICNSQVCVVIKKTGCGKVNQPIAEVMLIICATTPTLLKTEGYKYSANSDQGLSFPCSKDYQQFISNALPILPLPYLCASTGRLSSFPRIIAGNEIFTALFIKS